jgi:protein involved in polysaccharide export with SLBB domain
MAKKKWISGAIKRPGALTKKAKAKNMTITQYCAQEGLSTRSKRQCALAKTLRKFR